MLYVKAVSTADERRNARRANWIGGVAASFEHLEALDAEQSLAVAAVERLTSVWSLVEENLALRGEHGSAPRLQRLVGGVRPLKG